MQPSNASGHRTRSCGQPGPREKQLGDTGFDMFEVNALEVMRLIFAAMGHNLPRYAPDIEEVAIKLFGRPRGSIILSSLTNFVQTMAMSRSEKFHYSNPFCAGCACVVTQNEFNLVSILHHIRRGSYGSSMTFALFLCDARPVSFLMDAAADLASLAPVEA